MTPKERAIRALTLQSPHTGDIVPHFELQMDLTEAFFGKRFVSAVAWESGRERDVALRSNAELFIQIADRFGYAIIACHGNYDYIEGPLDPGTYDRAQGAVAPGVYLPTLEDHLEMMALLKDLDGSRRLLLAKGDSTMRIPSGRRMEDVIAQLFESGDRVKAAEEERSDIMLERARRMLEAGADGFWLGADYCTNAGPFLPPPMFSEFVAPYLAKLVREYRRMGAYVIKHTDGNIMPILDELVGAGPHALHSLDPMAGVDIREVKRLVGDKVCLCGNVNCALLQTGTEEEILESCRYAMESGKPGGGYIFSTSNTIYPGMPPENYELMLDYYRKNRDY